jgi:hypothetical protein
MAAGRWFFTDFFIDFLSGPVQDPPFCLFSAPLNSCAPMFSRDGFGLQVLQFFAQASIFSMILCLPDSRSIFS